MGAESKREAVQAEELLAEAGFLARLARGLVRGAEQAEDLVQDTFVAALEHPPREAGTVRAWLAIVARNLARNARRGERRRGEREAAAARKEASEPEELALERLELQKSLFELLLALPVESRTVLYLRYYEDLGPAAIAARLGVPLKTVKSRQTRALALLRERLDARTRGGRRAWVVALLPLARSASVAPASGGIPEVLGGLAMKKTLGVVATVLILALSWFSYTRLEGGSRARAHGERTTPLVTAPAPLAAPLTVELAPREEGSSADDATRRSSNAGRAEITLLWSDGTPAQGLGASMRRAAPRGAPLERVRATSDAQGLLRFEELATGTNRLVVDLRANFELEIESDATRVTSVTLPTGAEVRGVVRGASGQPLAGAAIVFDAGRDWPGWANELEVVTRTAADGGFVLRDVDVERELGARATGHLPSPLVALDDLPVEGGARRLELQLEAGEARLTGLVLAPDGSALADARVLCGPRNGHQATGPQGGRAIAPGPLATRTDEQGRFVLEDALPLGAQPVHCVARGFAPWSATITLVAGTNELEIRLVPPARIEGRVVDVAGLPAAGMRVTQSVEHLGGWYLDDAFPPPEDVSDAQGAFVLEWVAPGLRELNASDYARPELGRARAAVECRAGETARCELRLELGLTIAGRVTDERGQPLSGWYIDSRPSNLLAQWYPRTTHSDRDGRFRLVNLGEGTHDLNVRKGATAARLEVKAVPTGTEDLELVVPGAEVEDGELVGRLVDPAGRAFDDVELTLWRVDQNEGFFLAVDPATGIFRGSSFPGEYHLQVTRAGAEIVQVEPFELVAGQVTELGDLALAARGQLELVLSGLPVADPARLRFHLEGAGRRQVELENDGRVLRSPEVLAGRWRVVLGERELVVEPAEFEVLPGGVTRGAVAVRVR